MVGYEIFLTQQPNPPAAQSPAAQSPEEIAREQNIRLSLNKINSFVEKSYDNSQSFLDLLVT